MSLAAAVLVIINVNIIDGTGAPPSVPQTVLIRSGRIDAIGNPAIPANAERIDGSGKFLIPGLWDMHTHVFANAGEQFPKLLARGVTGIRNMHLESANPLADSLAIRRQVESGKLAGPRIVTNGAIIDGPHPTWPASTRAGDAAEARRVAVQLKRQGADFLKPYDFLPRDAYFALAEEARRLHMPLAGHVPIWVTAEEAVRAGQRSIEHLNGVFEACTADGNLEREFKEAANLWPIVPKKAAELLRTALRKAAETYDERICAPLYTLFAEKQVWHCPTLVVLGPVRVQGLKVVGAMHRAGVKLLAGTDAGNPGIEPGESLHRELELLVEAGLSPEQALATATRNPAEYLGRMKDFGTIEKGKLADLVLLDANPLDDVRNTRRISAVIVRGVVYR